MEERRRRKKKKKKRRAAPPPVDPTTRQPIKRASNHAPSPPNSPNLHPPSGAGGGANGAGREPGGPAPPPTPTRAVSRGEVSNPQPPPPLPPPLHPSSSPRRCRCRTPTLPRAPPWRPHRPRLPVVGQPARHRARRNRNGSRVRRRRGAGRQWASPNKAGPRRPRLAHQDGVTQAEDSGTPSPHASSPPPIFAPWRLHGGCDHHRSRKGPRTRAVPIQAVLTDVASEGTARAHGQSTVTAWSWPPKQRPFDAILLLLERITRCAALDHKKRLPTLICQGST